MPKSKRDKEVTLTKVKRKGKESKSKLVDDIRQCVDEYENVFAFSVDNIRSSKLAAIRTHFKTDGRFFFGKNKVMALSLGRIAQEEYKEDLHRVSKLLNGQCGLLFTNQSIENVVRYFKTLKENDYARSGNIATETIELDAGPLDQFAFSLEPQLRKLGLPTKLEKGIVTLTQDHVVCRAGEKLTPEQAKILQYLGHKMAEFRIHLLCVWSKNESTDDSQNSSPTFKKLIKIKTQMQKQRLGKKSSRKSKNTIQEQENMDTD
jgi:mRNA turnover protein 4